MHPGSSGHTSTYRYAEHDRYNAPHSDASTIAKVRSSYWTAKQLIRAKFGKPEDENLVASDSELDSKLQVFYSIQDTCEQMLACIEHYQDFICELSQDENSLGRFLKASGKKDSTQAGKMMAAVGRAETFTAQQRLALRVPLVRLYDELDVFTERAVADTEMTVDKCERARMTYRGSLLWMKNCSKELDPDTYRQMDKFRKVQASVRKNKAKFDKCKLDCLQKIDLLAASRANLFSNLMANYQNCLLHFWERTTQAQETVSENFKGYQHYDFVVLKELAQPNKDEVEEKSVGFYRSIDELIQDDKPSPSKETADQSLIDLSALGDVADLITPDASGTSADLNDLIDVPQTPTVDQQFESLFAGAEYDQIAKQEPTTDGQSSTSDTPATTSQLIDAFLDDQGAKDTHSLAYQWQNQPPPSASSHTSPQHKASGLPSMHRLMPSELLDLSTIGMVDSPSISKTAPGGGGGSKNADWFSMFAELDPLKQDGGGAA